MFNIIKNKFKDKSKMSRDELAQIGIHVARDGSRHKVKDIDDSYLLNLYKFYYKVAESEYILNNKQLSSMYMLAGTVQGEMAQYSIYDDIDQFESSIVDSDTIFTNMPIVNFITKEIEKRGLNV